MLQHRPSPLCSPKHQPQFLRGKLMRGIDSEPLPASGSSQPASTMSLPSPALSPMLDSWMPQCCGTKPGFFHPEKFPPVIPSCWFTFMPGLKPFCTCSSQGWIRSAWSWRQGAPAGKCVCISHPCTGVGEILGVCAHIEVWSQTCPPQTPATHLEQASLFSFLPTQRCLITSVGIR